MIQLLSECAVREIERCLDFSLQYVAIEVCKLHIIRKKKYSTFGQYTSHLFKDYHFLGCSLMVKLHSFLKLLAVQLFSSKC